MAKISDKHFDKHYWLNETHVYYQKPYLRLEKCARLVNRLAGGQECELLDIGCGPATLRLLLRKNIHYYGIDLAIHMPGPNFIETDLLNHPIAFQGKKFDIAVATGLFEYMGPQQRKKLSEIREILTDKGVLITSYTNFNHLHAVIDYEPYNNIMPIGEFKRDLELFFKIQKVMPVYYNWRGTEPRKKWSHDLQKYISVQIPIISSIFAVSYFFICSPLPR